MVAKQLSVAKYQLSVAKYQKLGPTAKNRLQIWNLREKLRVLR